MSAFEKLPAGSTTSDAPGEVGNAIDFNVLYYFNTNADRP